MATRTVAVLKCFGIAATPENPVRLPAWYLLEFGALTALVDWERLGLVKAEWGLPSGIDASDEIVRRLATAEKSEIAHIPLTKKVFEIWMEYFAWSAPELLGSQVTIDSGDEDRLVDQLAHFLLDVVRGEAATRKEDTPDAPE